jgi:hypothetical protein
MGRMPLIMVDPIDRLHDILLGLRLNGSFQTNMKPL